MTTAIAAHDTVEKDAADDVRLAAAMVNAKAWLGDTAEFKSAWRLSEDEIVRASITVILVALVTVIGVAAVAILTMG
jgi:hypothetical protein